MNRKLSDSQIAAAASLLQRNGQRVTGRALRATLRREYGISGKTARLFAMCRQLTAAQTHPPIAIGQLQRELLEAQESRTRALEMRDQALARAERAEARELAHQDRWASEIHALREAVEHLKAERLRRQSLEEQIVRLQRELQSLRR